MEKIQHILDHIVNDVPRIQCLFKKKQKTFLDLMFMHDNGKIMYLSAKFYSNFIGRDSSPCSQVYTNKSKSRGTNHRLQTPSATLLSAFSQKHSMTTTLYLSASLL